MDTPDTAPSLELVHEMTPAQRLAMTAAFNAAVIAEFRARFRTQPVITDSQEAGQPGGRRASATAPLPPRPDPGPVRLRTLLPDLAPRRRGAK